MGWLGFGEEAKGIGEGVSNVTQGIRHLITGDIPPEIAVKLEEIAVEAQKVHAKIVESDNKAGGFNKLIRPATFALTFVSWLAMLILMAFTDIKIDKYVVKELSAFLYLLVPSFFIYRTFEKLKGLTK